MSMGLCFGNVGIGECGGGGTKAQTSYNSTMNSLVSQTASYISSNSSKTASSVFAQQRASLVIGGDVGPNCDITQAQTLNLSQQTSGQLDDKDYTNMASMVSTGLTDMLNQSSSATSQLGSGATQSQDNVNITKNVQTVVNNTINKSTYQEVLSQTFADQGASIVVGGSCNGKITQTQSLVANVIAMNLMNVVATALMTDTSTTNVFTQLSQTSTAKGGGFAEVLDSFFGGIANVVGASTEAVAMIVGVICCLLCAGVIAFFVLGGQHSNGGGGGNGSEL
jgi:hypothetical protein